MAYVLPTMRARPSSLFVSLNPATLGIGIAVLGFLLFTMLDTLAKYLSDGYPIHQIIFFNALFTMVPVLILLMSTGGLGQLRNKTMPLLLVRGLTGMTAALGGFFAFSMMPLADVYAILFSAPLFITALSVPLLKETVGIRRWAAVTVGFVGVLIMLQPGQGLFSIGALGALVGALGYASSVILARRIGQRASAGVIAFYANLVVMTVMGVWTAVDHVVPSAADMALFACAGLLGGSGLICVTTAFRALPAAVVAPFQYTQMIWAVLFGFLLWGDIPGTHIALGCAVVIASGLYILHRETTLGRPTIRNKGSATVG